jgi:hypothetical protein
MLKKVLKRKPNALRKMFILTICAQKSLLSFSVCDFRYLKWSRFLRLSWVENNFSFISNNELPLIKLVNYKCYNFEVQIPSINQVTTKSWIWRNYNYYIMITLSPNRVKRTRRTSRFEKSVVLSSIHVPFLELRDTHGTRATCWLPPIYTYSPK